MISVNILSILVYLIIGLLLTTGCILDFYIFMKDANLREVYLKVKMQKMD